MYPFFIGIISEGVSSVHCLIFIWPGRSFTVGTYFLRYLTLGCINKYFNDYAKSINFLRMIHCNINILCFIFPLISNITYIVKERYYG